jgi:hypothetical protein
MPQIVLTPEQLSIISQSKGAVDVVDQEGRPLASMMLFSAEDLEDIERWKQRQHLPKQPGIPAARVEEFLRKLQEVDERQGIGHVKMRELLRRTKAGEPL